MKLHAWVDMHVMTSTDNRLSCFHGKLHTTLHILDHNVLCCTVLSEGMVYSLRPADQAHRRAVCSAPSVIQMLMCIMHRFAWPYRSCFVIVPTSAVYVV